MNGTAGGKAVLLAALLLATPLAGCLSSAEAATAKEEREPAQQRAESWASDAQLASVVGVEGSFASSFADSSVGQAEYWSKARDDGEVGDGLCKVWRYEFVSESKPDEVYVVVLDHEGNVLANETEARGGDDDRLGEWDVDSDEALETAKDANEGFREGVSSENYRFVIQLDNREDYDNPVWFVAGGGGDSSGGGGGFVIVDAVTGEVLQSHGGSSSGDYGP